MNGKAEAVAVSPETYDRLVEMAMGGVRDRIAVGLRQARAGQLIDGEAALKARRARRNGAGRNR